jgi:hypothetical protein
MGHVDLQHRAVIVRDRILKDYNWDEQARRIVEFPDGLVHKE